MLNLDPVMLEIIKNALASVAEDMGAALMRTGFSSNIKERKDYSCALFDRQARSLVQGDHMPVHLGSMPEAVRSVLQACDLDSGDVALVNDPYAGGTHLPDLTLVAPVYMGDGGPPDFYLACRAHHADIGGETPGSMGVADHIDAEGLRIPPTPLMRSGQRVGSTWEFIANNVRDAAQREGDLEAQLAALYVGHEGLVEAQRRFGMDALIRFGDGLLDYSETMVRAALRNIPPGDYAFEDAMEGLEGEVAPTIRVGLRISRSGDMEADFCDTDDQVPAPINAPRAVTISAISYVVRCLAGAEAPWNEGILRPLTIRTRPGSLVHALAPAAVAGGNVETSQRIVDVVLGALAPALPERIPAASQGTMNNLCMGGTRADGREWTYYETLPGGAGAGPSGPGASGIHTHMTNSSNTPMESMEHEYPVRVLGHRVRSESGGKGFFRGGDGIVREYEFLEETTVTLLADRRSTQPFGIAGGSPGAPGTGILVRADGKTEELSARCVCYVHPGDRLRVETPGGGGWGHLEGQGS